MAKNKTTETKVSVKDFIQLQEDAVKRSETLALMELFQRATGFEPKMWGESIIGFGSYHYMYESGREGDAPIAGFSPRKDAFALYLAVFDGREQLLEQLGKHTTGKACIYIKKLSDIKEDILQKLIKASTAYIVKTHS